MTYQPPSRLGLSGPSNGYTNNTLSYTAYLSDSNNIPLNQKILKLYSSNDIISSGTTDSNGLYTFDISFNNTGTYYLYAYFEGGSIQDDINSPPIEYDPVYSYEREAPLSPEPLTLILTEEVLPRDIVPTTVGLSTYLNLPIGTLVGYIMTIQLSQNYQTPLDNSTITYSFDSSVLNNGSNLFDISLNQIITKKILEPTDGTYVDNSYLSGGQMVNIKYYSTSISVKSFDSVGDIEVSKTLDIVMSIPYGIEDGKISDELLSMDSGDTFYFTDLQYQTLTQQSAIYFGTGELNLGSTVDPGTQVSIVNSDGNNKYVFSSVSNERKNSLNISDDIAIVLKVTDLQGNVQTILNPPIQIDLFLDSNLGQNIILNVDGNSAGTGTFIEEVDGKFKYRATLTRGDGLVTGSSYIPGPTGPTGATGGTGGTGGTGAKYASAGSDPHITTLFGHRYDFHPSTRKNYTLFKSKDINIKSHFTGLKNGIFYDKVELELPNNDKIKIDFNNKKIRGESSLVNISKENFNIKYINRTSNKSISKIFDPLKTMTKLSVQGTNPLHIFIDFQTRYVHFEFPQDIPEKSEISGLIVEPLTRLD